MHSIISILILCININDNSARVLRPTNNPTVLPTNTPIYNSSSSPTNNPTNSTNTPTNSPTNTPTEETVPPTMCPFNDTTPPKIICPVPIYVEAYEDYPEFNVGCSNAEGGSVSFNYDGITRVGQQGNWLETDIWNPLNCSQEILYKDLRSFTCIDQCKNKAQCYEEIIIKDTTKP
eukprot:204020_1